MSRLRKGARITVLVRARFATGTAFAVVERESQHETIGYRAFLLLNDDQFPDLYESDEGTLWMRGWSEEAKNALLAVAALAPSPEPAS